MEGYKSAGRRVTHWWFKCEQGVTLMSHSVFLKVRRESFILFIMSRFAHVNQRQHAVVFTTTLKQNACIPFISATLVAFNRRSALT